ncbi:MAG: recombinase family protein [Synergistaceae bacterium]|nr:recombinase family protein [Synergistaceae bacterium]
MSSRPLEQRKIKFVQAAAQTATETKPGRRILRTAAYCRVSTESKEQETSFNSQVTYYTDKIGSNPDWTLVKIYADPAVSGTSRRNRIQFDEMLYDCIHGKIDQIMTKSMSRFARNQLDCLAVIRLLKGLHPPVSVIFEDDKIDSTDLSTEVVMTIFSMLAEQESAKKSDNVRWGLDRRRDTGHYLTPVHNLLGFDKTKAFNKDDREMIIVEDEAKVVRCIYTMFLIGYKLSEIAVQMTMAGVATSKGNTTWNTSSVLGILRNERYAGDVRTNKTYRENYRIHHTVQNKGEREYVYETDHHPAIVSHAEYEMAQKLIASHKFGYDPYVTGSYCLRVIEKGLFKGFIPINIHWAGSELSEYIELARTVELDCSQNAPVKKVRCYPGFEVVRPEDIGHGNKPGLKITPRTLTLNTACLSLVSGESSDYIEFLLNPLEKLLAVRFTEEQMPGAVRWKRVNDGKCTTVAIGCAGFSELLYKLMNWPKLWNTTVLGQPFVRNGETVLLFGLEQYEINALPYERVKKKAARASTDVYYDIELMIAQQIELLHQKKEDEVAVEESADEDGAEAVATPRREKLHPGAWYDSFGQRSEEAEFDYRRYQFYHMGEWNVDAGGIAVAEFDHHVDITEDVALSLLGAISAKDKAGVEE